MFFCGGKTDILKKIIDDYCLKLKLTVDCHFFNDNVRQLVNPDRDRSTQNKDYQFPYEKLEVKRYLIKHLFANIVYHLNVLRIFCGIQQFEQKVPEYLIWDLRICEYAFNYFFPIFQKDYFGKSHRIDSSEFLGYCLDGIWHDINDPKYETFGFQVECWSKCKTCKAKRQVVRETYHQNINSIMILAVTNQRKSTDVQTMLNKRLDKKSLKLRKCESCTEKITLI